ncbi:hypothetical protein LTR08_006359 [Meristemomyces frigidus]|nr:hypothetical protein LTR08_006359 [Meristemomyces frigidus]
MSSFNISEEERTARTPEDLFRSGASSSPLPSPTARSLQAHIPADAADVTLENDGDGEVTLNLADFMRARHRARRALRFAKGARPNGATYLLGWGRLQSPVADKHRHTSDDDEVQSVDESSEDFEGDDADANADNQAPWKVGNPMQQPLTYDIPVAGGGTEPRTIKFTVDFNNAASVSEANKRRRQGVWRQKRKLGLPMLRPSTQDRLYTQRNDAAIVTIHREYARENGGRQVSYARLAERYHQLFPGENRSHSSLSSHIARIDALKEMRATFLRRH